MFCLPVSMGMLLCFTIPLSINWYNKEEVKNDSTIPLTFFQCRFSYGSMPYTWYDGASEGSFRFRINDGSVNGQESPEPAYTETKASILRRYFNTKARFDYIKPQIRSFPYYSN